MPNVYREGKETGEVVMTCCCNAYRFPHRQGGGLCGQVRALLALLQQAGHDIDGDEAAEWMGNYNTPQEAFEAWLVEDTPAGVE